MSQQGIRWRGIDGAGFYYGFYQDGPAQYQVDIAVPGKGLEPHPGPDFKVFVNQQKIGSMPTLKGAAALADLYFTEGRHRVRPRTVAAPPRETIENPTRERRSMSMRDVLENYLSRDKPPRGRSR